MYDYHLDPLGVAYDAELELRAKHRIAEEVVNSIPRDEDFHKNCIKAISEKLQTSYEDDIQDVWRIIKKEYLNGGC